MTPHAETQSVGIRELHNQLSRYVRHVRDGGEVVVTMRGRAVARLTPIDDRPDPLAELRARGLITDPQAAPAPPAPAQRVRATGPVSDLVGDQRR